MGDIAAQTVHSSEVSMADEQTPIETEARKEGVRSHQPGQADFRVIKAEDLDWEPFPAFPPPVRLAVVWDSLPRRALTRSG